MYYYIYKITNDQNGKAYVGKRQSEIPIDEDVYFGSGKILKLAIKKHGRHCFSKEVLEVCESEAILNEREVFWIKEVNSFCPIGYNINEGGRGGDTFTYNPNKDIIRKKFSLQNKGRRATDETKRKMSKARVGKNQAPCEKRECLYCNKIVDVRNIKRWHDDNCLSHPKKKNVRAMPTVVCPFCDRICFVQNAHQYHFEYCKGNPNRLIRDYSDAPMNKIESRAKAIETRRKRGYKTSDESNAKRREKLQGRVMTETHKKNLSLGGIERWKVQSEVYKCKYCSVSSRLKVNIIRWHDENCKMRP